MPHPSQPQPLQMPPSMAELPLPGYAAPRWLPGGHLQTTYPATCIAKPRAAYRRERWDTPDGDFIDVDFVDGSPGQPFITLFHGLEGSSDSHYARALMAHVRDLGWSGAIPHFRGCSVMLHHEPRFYHSSAAVLAFRRCRRYRLDTASAGSTHTPARSGIALCGRRITGRQCLAALAGPIAASSRIHRCRMLRVSTARSGRRLRGAFARH